MSKLLLALRIAIVLYPLSALSQAQVPTAGRSRPQQLPVTGRTQAGSVTTGQATTPAASGSSVSTLNSSIQVQGEFQGSTPAGLITNQPLPLTLEEAIRRGLTYNLGVIGAQETERYARAQRLGALAELLPDIRGTGAIALQQTSLATVGLQSARGFASFEFARVLGPFNFFDAGVVLSQSVLDLTAVRNYRSNKELTQAATLNVRDSRDLVILAVGASYLQIVAAMSRVDSARAQLESARALYDQAVNRHTAGLNALIDVNRSQVELQTQRLRLISLETDLASQKLSLGRLIGLALGQEFTLTTPMEYRPAPLATVESALEEGFANRADLQAAKAQVRAAEQARRAAEGQNTAAISIGASYLLAGANPAQSNGVFSVFAAVDFPIWRGGRNQADIDHADAALSQRQAEYDDTYARVDVEVRNAFIRLKAATEQVGVAESNRTLAQDTLQQARDRFAAGVTDTIEVVQAQESVASAEQDYISSLYSHYLARLSLARATGNAEKGIASLLRH